MLAAVAFNDARKMLPECPRAKVKFAHNAASSNVRWVRIFIQSVSARRKDTIYFQNHTTWRRDLGTIHLVFFFARLLLPRSVAQTHNMRAHRLPKCRANGRPSPKSAGNHCGNWKAGLFQRVARCQIRYLVASPGVSRLPQKARPAGALPKKTERTHRQCPHDNSFSKRQGVHR